MCGISGIVYFKDRQVYPSELQAMMKTMKHRGPDDESLFTDQGIGFGHVRLSIIDLSAAGRQPMACSDDRFVIIFNGEIYNYLELKKSVVSEFTYKTNTDTEVLLNCFKKFGPECLHLLNGMFAFAVFDKKTREIFIARDRFGIKPLYYHLDAEKLVFASDIPPILTQITEVAPNDQAIYDYLVFDRVAHNEMTFFKEIKKLQHGQSISIGADGKVKIQSWYLLKDNLKGAFETPAEYKEALTNSIGLQLRSDVPVGACLSGGLDSSSIVSLWTKNFPISNLNTFSAVYDSAHRADESKFIKLFGSEIFKMHFTVPTADGLIRDMDALLSAHSEPFPDTSIYAEYKVLESAKNIVKVLFSGQGADEALAGYDYFYGYYFKELLLKLKLIAFFQETFSYIGKHRSSYALKAFAFFMLPASMRSSLFAKKKRYVSRDLQYGLDTGQEDIQNLFGAPTLSNAFLKHFEHKMEHHLIWGDRSSMWFSLEMRFPFLDHNLVERSIPVASNMHIKNGVSKSLLRESMKGTLNEKIRIRLDKVGFETPQDEWLRSDPMKSFVLDIVGSASFQNRGYVTPSEIKNMFSNHLKRKGNFSKEIWKCINLELWFKKYIDNKYA
ncbi:MAG: asparagine synthase (glutamine-hydrolyzing) [Bacteroidetes bacterium]|nr:MAG: asparagine synthase (glutamine-hydrolyzing) [Bacteroidota bacterium]